MPNDVHLHLLINHVPILGTLFALAAGLYGTLRRQQDVVRVFLLALVVCGMASFAAVQTGERAEDLVEDLPGVTEDAIEEHEEAAEIANYAAIGLALVALGILVWRRNVQDIGLASTVAVLIGAAVVFVLMARAAHFGGAIRHPEIRSEAAPRL